MTPLEAGLERFVGAQESVFDAVCAELTAGKKVTHWMWFIFPQLRQLGRSATAKHFGIENRDEALAYWQHPLLGPRLRLCAERVLAAPAKTAEDIFGPIDAVKLKSCMTLFEAVAGEEAVFGRVLERYCAGDRDEATIRLLS